MKLNTTEEIIEDIRQGKMVVIMDDEDRENEGDLLMAASAVSADDVNFMARYGRGLICLTLTQQRCQQLNLPLMINGTDVLENTNFTMSIEAAEGVTTGISAADRAVTVLAAVKEDAQAKDLVQPGHIFPLMAQPGGVLTRAGHTEAGCDLAGLAGLDPSAMIVEILNEDGTMARRPDLETFAKEHNLKIGTIEDLISFRLKNEKTVNRISECEFSSDYGNFKLIAYRNSLDSLTHYALLKAEGEIDSNEPVVVRVHMKNALTDSFGLQHSKSWPLQDALKQISQSKQGVVVVLSLPDEDAAMLQWMSENSGGEQDDVVKTKKPADIRTDGVGAQILMDLGVKKMKLMTAPKIIHGLAGFGLEVVDYISGKDS
ncbi:3,4-dihydroxy-2-butanone 4-phosphate synthase / GTP cyclohydrolase II [hydrothermal vent metagenome]|uniref:3,4-dihydroxy-2-butanone 4-phosphate synthase / GTP cyclohydrolase II n=1 Tax=hydrothermal vent metagenome TaxID=652676 RepID=A0A3B0WGY4_9ZZZZ